MTHIRISPYEVIYTGPIDNDGIEDSVAKVCEPVIELDYMPSWFSFTPEPYYEEINCRYDAYLSTCETPELLKNVPTYDLIGYDQKGLPIYDDKYIEQVIPANDGVIKVSTASGLKKMDCGLFVEDLDTAGRDIRISSEGWAINDFGSIAYRGCWIYVDDDHLELTCLENDKKNIVLEVPF